MLLRRELMDGGGRFMNRPYNTQSIFTGLFFVKAKNPRSKTVKRFKSEDFSFKTRKTAMARLTPAIAVLCSIG